MADLPAAAVAKTFPKPEEELVASSILFAVAIYVVFVFCVSLWGSQAARGPATHCGKRESPVEHKTDGEL